MAEIMVGLAIVLTSSLAVSALTPQAAAVNAAARDSQAPPPAMCRELRECLQLAAEAEERHDFETFHDLAWRAVQLGPRNDPSLM